MDPLSAISVASTVVAFVDFSAKLLSSSRQAYRTASGRTREQASLDVICTDLALFCGNVEDQSSFLQQQEPGDGTSGGQLLSICHECVEASAELGRAIQGLKTTEHRKRDIHFDNTPRAMFNMFNKAIHAPHTAANTLSRALAEFRFDVNKWSRRLENLRTRMMTALLVVLWYLHRKNCYFDEY